MPYRTPDAANPRVRRTRERILAAARELLSEVGPAGLTYSLLAERAGVTRQTLYRHWPARPALLLGLILEGADGGYPEPGPDPGAVAAAWLASLRDGLRDSGRRIAVLGVAAQADSDPDSAEALAQLTRLRPRRPQRPAEPSGTVDHQRRVRAAVGSGAGQDLLRTGRPVTDEFIAAVVARWLAGPARTITNADVPAPNE